jgi:hypothetical protein
MSVSPGERLYRQIQAENIAKRAQIAARDAETATGDGDFITAHERNETAAQLSREARRIRNGQ